MDNNSNTDEKRCTRCGDCCRQGGPALHVEDLDMIRSEHGPGLEDVVTIRTGEYAFDQIKHSLQPISEEILKLKGNGGSWSCLFFNSEAGMCTIYDHRPAECRALDCHNTGPLEEVHERPHITRKDLIPEGHPILALIAEHDEQCSAARLAKLATPAATGDEDAARELEEMVRYDDRLRKMVPDRTGMDPQGMDFFFGRTARTLLRQFATAVTIAADGSMLFRKI